MALEGSKSRCFGPVITTGEPSSMVGQREENCMETPFTTTIPTAGASAATERAAAPAQLQPTTLGVPALDSLCQHVCCCLPTPGIPTPGPTYHNPCCITTAHDDRNQNSDSYVSSPLLCRSGGFAAAPKGSRDDNQTHMGKWYILRHGRNSI